MPQRRSDDDRDDLRAVLSPKRVKLLQNTATLHGLMADGHSHHRTHSISKSIEQSAGRVEATAIEAYKRTRLSFTKQSALRRLYCATPELEIPNIIADDTEDLGDQLRLAGPELRRGNVHA